MYTRRFPFRLPPGRQISTTDALSNVDHSGKSLELTLENIGILYVLIANCFSCEEEAKSFIVKIRSGLAWLLLNDGIATHAIFELQDTVYADDRQQFDILIDGGRPAVYLTSTRVCVPHPGQPSLNLITPSQKALDLVSNGLSFPKRNAFAEDPKLQLAVNLYSAYFTELSANARFLTLVMALEALAIGVLRTSLVLGLLNQWSTKVNKLMKNVAPDSDDAESLEALSRELLIRREDSIRRQIQTLVLLTLQGVPGVDAEQSAKTAKKLYDQRSKLLHKGVLDPQKLDRATSEAKSLVHLILTTRFKEVVEAE